MATTKFFIQSKKNPVSIYVRFRDGRMVDAKAKTNFLVNHEDWSNTKGRPKNAKNESLKILNLELDRFLNNLIEHYNKNRGKVDINSQWLKDFINPPLTEDTIPDKLVAYFDFYIKSKNKTIEVDSIRKYRNVQSILKDFEKHTKRCYCVKDFNNIFRTQFIEYAISEKKYRKGTVGRMIKFIKTVCYHAESNNIDVSKDLRTIKTINEDDINVIYLNPDEIKLIENANLKPRELVIARDWLLISIETGQRISDFMNFKKQNIRIEGKMQMLEFRQKKTKQLCSVPLSAKVQKILEKWHGDFPPKQTESDYNIYIKEVCQIAGLTELVYGGRIDIETNRKVFRNYPKYELVTSHIGRRSFASNNFGEVPTAILMSITGHKNEATFLKYIGKTRTELSKLLVNYVKV